MKCLNCTVINPEGARFCGGCGSPLDITAYRAGTQVNSPTMPMIGFPDAIQLGFQNYFNFRGRATRAEFWWFALLGLLVQLVGIIPIIGWLIGFIAWLAIIIPSISVTTRRLHDIGRSGWWLLFIFVAYTLVWLVFGATLVMGFISLAEPGFLGVPTPMFFLASFISSLAIIGLTAIWIVWLTRIGDLGPNKYGPDPRDPASRFGS